MQSGAQLPRLWAAVGTSSIQFATSGTILAFGLQPTKGTYATDAIPEVLQSESPASGSAFCKRRQRSKCRRAKALPG